MRSATTTSKARTKATTRRPRRPDARDMRLLGPGHPEDHSAGRRSTVTRTWTCPMSARSLRASRIRGSIFL